MKLGYGEKLVLSCFIIYTVYCFTALSTTYLLIILSLLFALMSQNTYLHTWRNRGIKGPEPNFLFGNLLQQINGLMPFDIDNNRKYGRIYGTFLMGHKEINIADAEMLKRILIKDFSNFINRRRESFFEGKSNIMNYMLLNLRSERWKEVRSVMSPSFSSGKLKSVFPIVKDCLAITRTVIERCISNNEGKIDAKKILGSLTMDIIAKSAFGADVSLQEDENSEFMRMATKLFDFSFFDPRLIFIMLFPNIAHAIGDFFDYQVFNNDINGYFVDVSKKIIAERIKNPRQVKADFLQMLIDVSCLKNGENSEAVGKVDMLTEMETVAQCFIFIAAGYETTTTALQFIFYSLAVNPEIQQKVYDEVVNIFDNEGKLDSEKLNKLTYLDQVIMETLRMYPPIGRGNRECEKDTTLDGLFISKGTSVVIPIFGIHYDQEYYEEPYKFNPDRFSDPKSFENSMTFMPFGHGPRHCIGMRFALMEIRTIVSSLLMQFKFTTPSVPNGTPLEITTVGFTKAKYPIVLKAEYRFDK